MSNLIDKIRQYEEQSRIIEPDAEQRQELFEKVNGYTEDFLASIKERNAYTQKGPDGKGLLDQPIAEQGLDIDSILTLYKDNVEQQGINTVSGKFLGYIAPCSMFYSALGDYIAAITDPFSTDYSASPE